MALAQAIDAITAQDAQYFFFHCGYTFMDQPLCNPL